MSERESARETGRDYLERYSITGRSGCLILLPRRCTGRVELIQCGSGRVDTYPMLAAPPIPFPSHHHVLSLSPQCPGQWRLRLLLPQLRSCRHLRKQSFSVKDKRKRLSFKFVKNEVCLQHFSSSFTFFVKKSKSRRCLLEKKSKIRRRCLL